MMATILRCCCFWFSLAPMVVLAIGGHLRAEEGAAGQSDPTEIERLIDGLASPNNEPKIESLGWLSLGIVDDDYDFAKQGRIVAAVRSLSKRGDATTLRHLLEHRKDMRYSYTVFRNDYVYNWYVWMICSEIARHQLSYPFTRHLESGPQTAEMTMPKEYWADSRQWARDRAEKSLWELQVEVCQWAIERAPDLTSMSAEQKSTFIDEVKGEIETLERTRTPLIGAFRFPGNWYEPFDARTAQKHREQHDRIMARRAAAQQKRDKLIDALASQNEPPRIGKLDDSYVPLFAGDYDWEEQSRVLKALEQIDLDGETNMWLRLLERAGDSRYAITYSERRIARNVSVGEMCEQIAVERLYGPIAKCLASPEAVNELGLQYYYDHDLLAWTQDESRSFRILGGWQMELCRIAVLSIPRLTSISEDAKAEATKRLEEYIRKNESSNRLLVVPFDFPGRHRHMYNRSEAEQIRKRYERQ